MATTLVSTGIQFPDTTIQTTAATAGIPSGSVMLFVQTAAPTGWTKSTTHNNKALRVVSGTVSPGGSNTFTAAFGTPSVSGSVSLSGSVGSTTLSTAQLASHTHTFSALSNNPDSPNKTGLQYQNGDFGPTGTSSSTGSNSSHNHSFSGSGSLSSATASINVQYVDVIIATKD